MLFAVAVVRRIMFLVGPFQFSISPTLTFDFNLDRQIMNSECVVTIFYSAEKGLSYYELTHCYIFQGKFFSSSALTNEIILDAAEPTEGSVLQGRFEYNFSSWINLGCYV